MRILEGEEVKGEKREKQVCKDEQARPQDDCWALFRCHVLRLWSESLTLLLRNLLFQHLAVP